MLYWIISNCRGKGNRIYVFDILPSPWARARYHSTLSSQYRTPHTCDPAPIWSHIGSRPDRQSTWADRCRSPRTSRCQSNSCLPLPWRRVFPAKDWIVLIDCRIVFIVTEAAVQGQSLKALISARKSRIKGAEKAAVSMRIYGILILSLKHFFFPMPTMNFSFSREYTRT